ncbi:hypothetical protein BDZ89DRAFT_1151180 [Hymenopellis radicata]|nr:hypothetical protein BDZ89DRAFT_1151180 [Hymenopellis radicata]
MSRSPAISPPSPEVPSTQRALSESSLDPSRALSPISQDLPTLLFDSSPANLDAHSDIDDSEVLLEQDGEENENVAEVVDASVPDEALSPTLRDDESQGASSRSSPANWPRSVPLLPAPRTSNFAKAVSEDLQQDDITLEDLLFLKSTEPGISSADIHYKRVPSPGLHSVANFDFGSLDSPTGTSSSGRLRWSKEEERVPVEVEQNGKELGDYVGQITTSSNNNGRKRGREDEQEDREDIRPPANRARHDNFISRLVDRFTPQYLQYFG